MDTLCEDISVLCRICMNIRKRSTSVSLLASVNDNIYSFKAFKSGFSLQHIYETISGLQVQNNESFTQFICKFCVRKLRCAFYLRLNARNSYDKLTAEFSVSNDLPACDDTTDKVMQEAVAETVDQDTMDNKSFQCTSEFPSDNENVEIQTVDEKTLQRSHSLKNRKRPTLATNIDTKLKDSGLKKVKETFQCDHCGSQFLKKKLIIQHMKIHKSKYAAIHSIKPF